jgi:cellulase/cellobiase CelA1
MRAQNPDMKIVVAQIIPMSAAACATCPADVAALEQARSRPGRPASARPGRRSSVADLWTGYDAVADNVDGVHPNDTASRRCPTPGIRWWPGAGGARHHDPAHDDPARRPRRPPTPPPSGACTATYRVVSQWTGGFQGEVTVSNGSSSASAGWTATFTFANGQTVSQAWNATVTQTGATVTARNVDWNGRLAAGGSASFGFLASSTGANAAPAQPAP